MLTLEFLRRRLTPASRASLRQSFAYRILTLSAGMIGGQGILILLTPLLTRLYTPEEFGIFAIVGGMVSLLSTIIALRYEYAIPICADARSALIVCQLAGVSTVLMTGLFVLGIWLTGPTLADYLGAAAILPLLWLVPIALFAWGISNTLSFWALRQGRFRTKSINLVVQYGTQGASQTALGVVGSTGTGLVFGLILGHIMRLAHFMWSLSWSEWRILLRVARPGVLYRSAVENWRYPVFVGFSGFFDMALQLLPVILVGALYGPAIAGLYGLTQRVVALPTRLIAEAASQAFVYQGLQYETAEFHRFFKRTSLGFLALALAFLSPLLVAGPPLFTFAFGLEWTTAGTIAQLLVPINAARFVFVPISQSLNIVGRQEFHLMATGLFMSALVMSFGLGWWLQLEAMETIMLYSLSSTACYGVCFAAAWVQSKRLPRRSATAEI